MNTIKRILISVVISHPWTVIIFFTSFVLASSFLLPLLKDDPNPWLLGKSHPAMKSLEKLRSNYTSTGESIFVLLEAEKTIFNISTLNRILDLTKAFKRISLIDTKDMKRLQRYLHEQNGVVGGFSEKDFALDNRRELSNRVRNIVNSVGSSNNIDIESKKFLDNLRSKLSPVRKVSSLANIDNVRLSDSEIRIGPVFEKRISTEKEAADIQRQVIGNELFRNVFFTDDMRYTSIFVELAIDDNDSENQYLLYKEIKRILEEKMPGPEVHFISGTPVASSTLGHIIQTDSARLLPAVLFLVSLCLFLSFRMFLGVFTPLIVVLFSLVLTLSLKAILGIPINVITNTIPVFILSIGVADGIHIFSEFRDRILEGTSRRQAVIDTMQELIAPIALTSVTTSLAFCALAATEIIQLMHFGIFVAVGTIIAMFFSILYIPSLLMIVSERLFAKKREKRVTSDRYFSNILVAVGEFSIRNSNMVICTTFFISAFFIYGASKVVIDNNTIRYQSDDAPLVVATDRINRHGAGSSLINILIRYDGDEGEPFKKEKNLRVVNRLVEHIENRKEVGKVLGLTNYLKKLNYEVHQKKNEYERLPYNVEILSDGTKVSGDELIAQLIFLLEGNGSDLLTDVVSWNYTELNIPIVLKVNSSRNIERFIKETRNYADTVLPSRLSIDFSGSGSVVVEATNEIVSGQIISLTLSFLLVLAILLIAFKSFRIGIVAILPLVTTILFNFGIMGFFEIPLDVGTAVISSIVIGIGVDYSIHFLKRFRSFKRYDLTFDQSVVKTIESSGKAIASNAATVGTGFIAMLFSSLKPLFTMGWMIALTMIISAICTIVLLPAVLKRFRVVL